MYRLKTLSAVALAAAVSFGSNAQIMENPIIIPKIGSSSYRGFIYDEFNLENTTTFYVASFSYDDADYGKVPTWEYTVRLFDENLAPVRSFTIELKSDPAHSDGYRYLLPLSFDLWNDRGIDGSLEFTRTLFNTDDKLEYVTLDEDQWFLSSNGYVSNYRGFKIISEDGTILQKITFPEGYYINAGIEPDIFMGGGVNFIGVRAENENGSEADLFYRIDKEVGSVNFAMAMPSHMSVRTGDGVVTVDLPADADYSAVELVDMSGRVMGGVSVGGDRVSVDTSRLARGTYVLRAAGASGSECAKIVVR